jgi:hypothetical protein
LSFFQFPTGIDILHPAGQPDILNGEVTCFGIGIFSGVPGALVFFGILLAALLFLATGGFWLTITIFLRFVWTLVLLAWSFVWAVLQYYSLQKQYEDIADYVNRKVVVKKLRNVVQNLENRTSIESMNSRFNYWIPSPPLTKKQLSKKMESLESQNKQKDQTLQYIMGKIQLFDQQVQGQTYGPTHGFGSVPTTFAEGRSEQRVVHVYPSPEDYLSEGEEPDYKVAALGDGDGGASDYVDIEDALELGQDRKKHQ